MIRLTKTGRRQWLVEYRGRVTSVSSPIQLEGRKHSLTRMRHVICKVTRLDASQFRFIGNVKTTHGWVTEWIEQ